MCAISLAFCPHMLTYPPASVRTHIYPYMIILDPHSPPQSHAWHTGNFPGHAHTKHTYLHPPAPPSTLFDCCTTPTHPYAPYAPLYTPMHPSPHIITPLFIIWKICINWWILLLKIINKYWFFYILYLIWGDWHLGCYYGGIDEFITKGRMKKYYPYHPGTKNGTSWWTQLVVVIYYVH